MTFSRIGKDDRIVLEGVAYRGSSSDVDGHVLIRVDSGTEEEITQEALDLLKARPGYSFDPGWFATGRAKARLQAGAASIAHLDPAEQSDILFRLEFCKRFLQRQAAGEASRSDRSLHRVLGEIHAEILPLEIARLSPEPKRKRKRAPATSRAGRKVTIRQCPKPAAFREWFGRWVGAGYEPLSLRRRNFRSGNRTPGIDPTVMTVLRRIACEAATEKRPSLRKLHRKLKAEVTTMNEARKEGRRPEYGVPGRGALTKAVNELGAFALMSGRDSPDAARAHFAMVSTGLDVTRPLQRVEMDEWSISLMKCAVDLDVWEHLTPEQRAALKPARYVLCASEDAATRVMLGFSLRPTACPENALACLRMTVSDKSSLAAAFGALSPWDMCGSIEELCVDAGPSFIAEDFQVAAVAMGTTVEVGPSGVAKLRGRMERSFLSTRQGLLSNFTGQTFANVLDKGDYDPASRASAFVPEFAEAIIRYWVDVYHNTPHGGLGGETPANAWKRLTKLYGVIPAPDPHKMRAIFGLRLRRRLGKGGVRFLGLHYQSEAIQAHRRQVGDVDVDVRVDPSDLGAISWWNGSAWSTAACVRTEMSGVSTDTWTSTLRDLRRRFADEAEMTYPVVIAAMRSIEAIASKAERRAGLDVAMPTEEEVERSERLLALGFSMPDPDAKSDSPATEASVTDPLAAGFPTSGEEPSKPTASTAPVRKPRRGIRWEK